MAVTGDSVERVFDIVNVLLASILSTMEKSYMWQWKLLIEDFDATMEVKKEFPDQVMLELRFE